MNLNVNLSLNVMMLDDTTSKSNYFTINLEVKLNVKMSIFSNCMHEEQCVYLIANKDKR